MQSLLNGADCSASSNPLNSVLKREGVDNSLFRDRVGSPGASGSQAAFRPLSHTQQQGPVHAGPAVVPHPFNLSHLSAALSAPGPVAVPLPLQAQSRAPSDLSADWDRFRNQQHHSPGPQLHAPSGWADSFASGKGKGREMQQAPVQHQTQMMSPTYAPPNPFGGMQLPTYMGQMQPMYSGPQQAGLAHAPQPTSHVEMEAAFEAALADARAQTAADEAKVAEAAPVETAAEEVTEDPIEDDTNFRGELDAVWESLKPEAERLNQLAEWEAEYSQFVNGEDDTLDILEENLNMEGIGQTSLDDQLEFGTGGGLASELVPEDGLPMAVGYQFASVNKYDDLSPAEAWQESKRILASGGSLSDGALAIESFLRRATASDIQVAGIPRAVAWSVLGRTHAENEMEDKALAAFEEGRKSLNDEPEGRERVAGELLTNLAISYVNESLDLAALTTLHQLLTVLHPTQAGPAPSRTEFISSDNPWALHQRMTEQFLSLARTQYGQNGHVDPDVQVGLGTLYYMTGEFGEARSCWTAALGERPDDYLLWNRLGATLANGGDPEEAVDAYRRALEIKPTFVRAIANLGVACLNIGVHREAAEHFLAALALQPNDNGGSAPEAYSLWATLRRALIALDQPALAEQARPGTDLNVFRQAGFDF